MAYLGYMCLGGAEIINDCRTMARVRQGYGPPRLQVRQGDPCCGDLSKGLGYTDDYVDPTELPWYDGSQASIDFAGLLVENIEGLEPGAFVRPVTETAGVGAFIGQGRQSAPTVTVTALLLAKNCCAQEFGLRWLRNALRGSCGGTLGCAGEDLLFLSCEPDNACNDTCSGELPPGPGDDYDAVVLADDPLIYLKLDEEEPGLPQDSSGNGRHAAFAQGVRVPGIHVGSTFARQVTPPPEPYPFDVYGYGSFGTIGGFSLEFWFTSTGGVGDTFQVELYETTDTPDVNITLTSTGNTAFVNFGGGNVVTVNTPGSLFDGTSHHIVMTFDNSLLSFYSDGVLFDSDTIGTPDALDADEVYGASTGSSNVTVDSFALYGSALSAARVLAHYATGIEGSGSGPFDFEAWLAPYYRTLKGAALTDGPRVIEKVARACADCEACPIYRVQFVLAASSPCVFLDPVEVAMEMPFTCDEGADCIEWVGPDEDCPADCPMTPDCSSDPDCPSSVAPPSIPSIVNPCVDECISVVSCVACVDIPANTIPSFSEGTLRVTVFAGSAPLRRVRLQVWQNPLDLEPDELDDCSTCAEINISYVAAGSTLVIDGTTRTSTMSCAGGTPVRANPFIASGTGSPSFSYPDLDGCAGQYTVCVTTADGAAADAWVTVEVIGREC